jgi:hypothetical protein
MARRARASLVRGEKDFDRKSFDRMNRIYRMLRG